MIYLSLSFTFEFLSNTLKYPKAANMSIFGKDTKSQLATPLVAYQPLLRLLSPLPNHHTSYTEPLNFNTLSILPVAASSHGSATSFFFAEQSVALAAESKYSWRQELMSAPVAMVVAIADSVAW
jgi:hypothetical protein